MSYYAITKILWVIIVPAIVIQLMTLSEAVLSGALTLGDAVTSGEFGWAAILAFCMGMLIPATRDAAKSESGISAAMPSLSMPKRKRRRTIDVDAMLRDLDAELEAMNE